MVAFIVFVLFGENKVSTLNGLLTLWNMYLLFRWSYSAEFFVDSEVSRVEIEPYRREKLFNCCYNYWFYSKCRIHNIVFSFFFFLGENFQCCLFVCCNGSIIFVNNLPQVPSGKY